MLKKTILVATAVAALGAAAAPAYAGNRYDDRLAAGAIIGGVTGAIIGSQSYYGNGAVVGGVVGALAGATIAGAPYYGYSYGPGYYRPAYVVRPAPVYYYPRGGYYRGPSHNYRGANWNNGHGHWNNGHR